MIATATSSSHVVHSLILNHWDASDFWSARSAPQQKTVPYVAHSRKHAKLCMVLLSQKGLQNICATHFMCKSVYIIDIITLCSSAFIYFLSLLLLRTYYSRVYPRITPYSWVNRQDTISSAKFKTSRSRASRYGRFHVMNKLFPGKLKCHPENQRLENEFPIYVPFRRDMLVFGCVLPIDIKINNSYTHVYTLYW